MSGNKAIFVLVFSASCVFLFQGCVRKIVVDEEINLELVEKVKDVSERIRKLPFKKDVEIVLEDEKDTRIYVERQLDEEMTDEKMHGIMKAYSKLGLIPKGFDYKGAVVDLLSAQIVGYYDPKEKKLFLNRAGVSAGLTGSVAEMISGHDLMEMVLSHELAHAVEDQYFDLDKMLDIEGNDDKLLAIKSLVEGDATMVSLFYIMGTEDYGSIAGMNISSDLKNMVLGSEEGFEGVPAILKENILFQYYGGFAFIEKALEHGGWEEVNRAFENPPTSTELLIHPEKYFARDDPPLNVELEGLDILQEKGWKKIEDNVIGELAFRILFEEWQGEGNGDKPSQGWGGDRFIAYESPEGSTLIALKTVWDTEEDAIEFEEAYRGLLEKKYSDQGKDWRQGDRWSVGLEAVSLERYGREVRIIEGAPQEESLEIK